jgi:XTP/dITP diphosphohydrolase
VSCFADDTGLEVESLQGAPGVLSARYAGPQRNTRDNMALLLSNLSDKSNRRARFRTIICLIDNGVEHLFEGIVNGTIIEQGRGEEGFGYDPIFLPDGSDKTFAEMSMEEKNDLSHRGRAIAALTQFLHQ